MNETDVRRIVRVEIRRLLDMASREPEGGQGEEGAAWPHRSEPDAVEAWVRSLQAGDGGTARDLLPRFLAETVDPGTWTVRQFGMALCRLRGGLLDRRKTRTGLWVYGRR